VHDERDPAPARPLPAGDPGQVRALIVEAAGPVFAHSGLARTSAADVAAAAGVPVEAVRTLFDSPEHLLVEVLTGQVEERITEARWLVESNPTDRPEAIAALSRLLIAVADKDTDSTVLHAELWLQAVRNPAVMSRLAARARRFDGFLGQVVRARFGRLDPGVPVPVEALATVLNALVEGLVQRRRTDPDAVPDELFGQALQWLIAGVRAAGPAPGRPGPS
jgi:AcrR family transcriptional regulator